MHRLAEFERYRLIAEAMPGFVRLDAPDGRTQYSNKRWLEYTGLTSEQSERLGWEHAVHPEDAARLRAERARTLASGETFECESRFRGKDGKYRWFLFRSIPIRDEDGTITSWLGAATDIDRQKRAEAQQSFLALASDVLGSTLDVEGTLERIARLAIISLGTWCQIDLPDSQGYLRATVVAHQEPAKEALLREMLGQHVYNARAELGPPAVLRTLKPQLLQRVDETAVEYVIPDARHRSIYRTVGYAAGIMVPLRIRDRVLGVLGIASDDLSRLYTDFDITTAMELGRRGAIALENSQSFAQQHRLASTLQRALLPATLPYSDRVMFWPAYAAAASDGGEAVGGDWYDAFELDADHIAVSMGDVAGHGVEAAVTMSVVRQAIRVAALEHHSPRDVLMRANRMAVLEARHSMITALFGIYNSATREFICSIAGHPQPLIVPDDADAIFLNSVSPPLGDAFTPDFLSEVAVTLPPRSTLIFFTDGLIEYKHDVEGAQERLRSAVALGTFLDESNPAQAIIDAVLDAPQRDDIAVLVMRVP